MRDNNSNGAEFAAELLAHIGRLINGHGYPCGLRAAQWMAIRYFARANRMSRTVSAFAEFHATTRGTASQTVKSLVELGYLSRVTSKQDARSAVINLTRKGQTLRRHDPIEDLKKAVGDLPGNLQENLAKALERIVGEVALIREQHRFGTCPNCKYLDQNGDVDDGIVVYQCNCFNEVLIASELNQICINYHPARRSK